MQPPRLRLLTAPALLAPRELPFLPERRFRLAVVLALSPHGCTRDELATLFWPERPQAAARSNLRKLILELRRLDLPGLDIDAERLRWPVASDAAECLAGAAAGDAAHALPGLDGGDSPAWDDWLRDTRARLHAAWRDALLAPGEPADTLARARRLLAADPDDDEARRAADGALRALGRDAPRAAEAPALVGRAADLRQALALLEEPGCRVLTITGPGGIGKSALALDLLRAAPGALHWIALEDLGDVAGLWPRIARELGFALGTAGDGADEVAAQLARRAAAAPLCLVLDNAEHLNDAAAGAPLAARLAGLLQAAPGLRCLVSSRTPLHLPGEWLLPLQPLEPAAARELFALAARAAAPGFDPARHGAELDGLLPDLAGLPLAIRLAAAWLRHLSPATLQRQLAQMPALLSQPESPDEHPAHASLRATFDRSWRLLPEPLRPVLAALAVAAAPLPLAAACRVGTCGPAELAALAQASLVDLLPDGRVAMHPLLRVEAAARQDPSAAAAAQARQVQAVVEIVRPWTTMEAFGGDAAIAAIEAVLAPLHQAWAHALATGDAAALTVLAPALGQVLQHRGGFGPVVDQFALAEALPAVQADPVALGAVALEHAALRFWLGDYPRAEASARRAVGAARHRRDPLAMAEALNTLAQVQVRQGRIAEADTCLSHALAQARRAARPGLVTAYAGNLSGIRRRRGRLAEAEALAREALAGYRNDGNADGEVGALNEIGQLAHLDGRFAEADASYAQALAVLDRAGVAARRPALLTHRASVWLDQGRAQEALALLQQAWSLHSQQGMPNHEATLRCNWAEALAAAGRVDEAWQQLRQVLALPAAAPGSPVLRSAAWSGAACAEAQGDRALAARLAAHAMHGAPAPTLPRHGALAARLAPPEDPPAGDLAELLRAPGA